MGYLFNCSLNGPDKSFWERFKENYVRFNTEQDEVDIALNKAQSQEILRLYEKYKVGSRAMGGLQVLAGSAQIGVAGLLMETAVGIVPGSAMLFRGVDNLVAGATTLASGEHTDTILHQVAQQARLGHNAATLVEIGADLGLGIAGHLSFKLSRDLKALDLAKGAGGRSGQNNISFSKPRVDKSRLPNTSNPLPSSSNSLAPASLKQINSLGSSSLSTDEYVSLYRAVMPAEVAQIKSTGKLENIFGIEIKYFSTTPEGARQYAAMAEKAFSHPPYKIIETKIPKNFLEELAIDNSVTVDRGISSIVIPTKSLNLLSKPEFLDHTFKPKP